MSSTWRRRVTAVTGGPTSVFGIPTWMPDGRRSWRSAIARGRAGSRNDLWLFAADGSEAGPTAAGTCRARHDLMPGSGMNSDVTRGEAAPCGRRPDGAAITFTPRSTARTSCGGSPSPTATSSG